MLTIQRKTSFGGITFTFLKSGKVVAAHVSGLLVSQAIAKLYGSALPIVIAYSDGREIESAAIMRRVIQADPIVETESFIDMCVHLESGDAFAEVPLISLRDKRVPEKKAVQRIIVRDSVKLEDFLFEHRDSIELQSLYEYLVDNELRTVRQIMKFLELPIRGGEEIEDHADQLVEYKREFWHERFEQHGIEIDPDRTFTEMAGDIIAYMENKAHTDSSLSFDDDEEELDFEVEQERFTDDFDGDSLEEFVLFQRKDDSELDN